MIRREGGRFVREAAQQLELRYSSYSFGSQKQPDAIASQTEREWSPQPHTIFRHSESHEEIYLVSATCRGFCNSFCVHVRFLKQFEATNGRGGEEEGGEA